MSEPEDCKGVCAREAFEMPEGCPPVSKPNVIDVVACTLPELEPTDFEQHPLVVDMPVVPFNVACTCLDVQTNLVVKDDRHTSNKALFRQASGPGGQDCCMGLYALDLELNIPTCSSDPPNITGSGSRGITVSGKGIPRQDEPCMFDLDMNIDVPCPLSDISIGDGQGIAEIEKEEDPDNCKLSFDVKVPCPLPGITFTVTGQASGSIVTGGSIAADGNNSTVDSGGNGGGRIGGNTVIVSSLSARRSARGASGGGASGGGASGGGGGGGGGGDCKLELKLNVPCQLPGVTFLVKGQASGGIKSASTASGPAGDCKTELEINVPCQLPKIRYKVRGYVNFDENVPGTDIQWDSLDCAKFFNLEVPCQLPNISVNVSGQASGAIVPHPVSSETITSEECDAAISINVPCQLDIIQVKDTVRPDSGPGSSGDPIVPANNNGTISLKDAIKLRRDPSVGPYSSDSCDLSLQLVAADISVPCEKLTANPSGQVSAQFKKDEATGANPCDKILDINVPCQLPGISFFVTGQATGSISSGDESDDCGRTLSINVPCQLDRLDFYDTTSTLDPVDAPSNGVVNTSSIVYLGTVTGGCDDEKMRIPIVRRQFKVPVSVVTGGNGITVSKTGGDSSNNVATYKVAFNGNLATGSTGDTRNVGYMWNLKVENNYIKRQLWTMKFKSGLLVDLVKGYSDSSTTTDANGWTNTDVSVGTCQ